jgi:hypothetical protein
MMTPTQTTTTLPGKLPIKFQDANFVTLAWQPKSALNASRSITGAPSIFHLLDQRLAVTQHLLLRAYSHDCAETHIFAASLGALILPVLCRCCGDDSRWPGEQDGAADRSLQAAPSGPSASQPGYLLTLPQSPWFSPSLATPWYISSHRSTANNSLLPSFQSTN